jgi:Protein of unknown function (DUF3500)
VHPRSRVAGWRYIFAEIIGSSFRTTAREDAGRTDYLQGFIIAEMFGTLRDLDSFPLNTNSKRKGPAMKITSRFTTSTLVAACLTFACLITGVIVDGKQKTRAAEAMSKAAQSFLGSLTPEQKAKATFSFSDEQRFDWHFVPQDRKGLPLKEMNDSQRKAAMSLLNSALSQNGYKKATSIISLEPVLAELEGPKRRFPRDPELYYVSIFGEPGKGDWGFRFEGHHISQNFTIAKGKMVVGAPSFFGTNPAQVLTGPQKGLRVLGAEEDLGRALVMSLDEKQRKQAIYDPKAPSDILSFDKRTVQPFDKVGIKASELNGKQYAMLEKLMEEYIGNVPDDVAAMRRAKLKATKKDELLFAWSGPMEKASGGYTLDPRDLPPNTPITGETMKFQGHYYRIQTPTFLIEYDNTQNNANHIHSVWRDFNGDWGRDLLAEHYQSTQHQSAALRR